MAEPATSHPIHIGEPQAEREEATGAVPMSDTPVEPSTGSQPRQLVRKTLGAVSSSASQLTSSMKESSRVFRFGLETMEKLVSPVQDYTWEKLQTYGTPLVDQLDEKLDTAIEAIETAADEVDQKASDASYGSHWSLLKEKFAKSKWYAKVDEILLQNAWVRSVNLQVVRPAEMFFNTATEVFMQTDSWETFIAATKAKMGPAWDDRLTSPSKAFYHTAVTCKAAVGAGRFFGGAIQLGKQRLHSEIDALLEKWDRVLGKADGVVDHLLPDLNQERRHSGAAESTDMDEQDPYSGEDFDGDKDEEEYHSGGEADSKDQTGDQEEMMFDMDMGEKEPEATSAPEMASRKGSWPKLARKVSDRLRQRVPRVTELPQQLKSQLWKSAWFQTVDQILSQNAMVQMMQSQMRMVRTVVVRPAEHFYNTAAESFSDSWKSSEQFMNTLRQRMGGAWDERLTSFAMSFYKSASQNNSPALSPAMVGHSGEADFTAEEK